MDKAKFIHAYYEPSDRKVFQGTRSSLCRMLNNGWEIKGGSNGSYILAKPVKAIFVFKTKNGKYEYDMRQDILDELDKQRMSTNSFEKFKDMLISGERTMYIDEYGQYELK